MVQLEVRIDNESNVHENGPHSPCSCDKDLMPTSPSSSPSPDSDDSRNYKWLVKEVMKSKGIDPKDVTNRVASFSQPFNGVFTCRNCVGKCWPSSWSWLVVNLKKQKIVRRFKQKCKDCGMEAVPFANVEQTRKVIEKVCDRYLKRIFDDQDPGKKKSPNRDLEPIPALSLPRSAKMHRIDLCEKCGYGTLPEPCYMNWMKMLQRHRMINEDYI